MTIFKALILLILFLIVLSLGAGMVSMTKDGKKSERTVKFLTIRIGLSVLAFILLAIGFLNGWIQPHGLLPPQQ
jgi:hypothetical protein